MTTTPAENVADVEQAKLRLEELRELIPAVNQDRNALYAERLALWRALRAAGVDRREMATLAGCSVDMVKLALSPKRAKAKVSSTQAG